MLPTDLVLWSTHFVAWYENTICSENSLRLAMRGKAHYVSGLSECFQIAFTFYAFSCWASCTDAYDI